MLWTSTLVIFNIIQMFLAMIVGDTYSLILWECIHKRLRRYLPSNIYICTCIYIFNVHVLWILRSPIFMGHGCVVREIIACPSTHWQTWKQYNPDCYCPVCRPSPSLYAMCLQHSVRNIHLCKLIYILCLTRRFSDGISFHKNSKLSE